MPSAYYDLRITYPLVPDADTLAEIQAGADSQDETIGEMVERWLGGIVLDAETRIEDSLPDGWNVLVTAAEGENGGGQT